MLFIDREERAGKRSEVFALYSGSGFAFEPEEKILLFSLADVKRDFEREKTIV
jgi:hypothetical protein